MPLLNKKHKIKRFLKLIYLKLFRINDSPQKIAIGFGLGVFLGILPGTGPLAALFCAFLLRVNRASSFLGSLLTNTWINVVTFLLAIKIGSAIMGLDWKAAYGESLLIFKNFRLENLLKLPALKIIFPLLLGYLVIAACLAIIAYLAALLILKITRAVKKKTRQSNG